MTETRQNFQLAVPFFMIADMQASLDFYLKYLDFKLLRQWIPRGKIEWCWLERDGIALMLQEKRNNQVENGSITTQPGEGVCICIQCKDALAVYHELTAKGLTVREPFVGNNMWVVAISDPDGYKLDFESATEVPEETLYSDWIKR